MSADKPQFCEDSLAGYQGYVQSDDYWADPMTGIYPWATNNNILTDTFALPSLPSREPIDIPASTNRRNHEDLNDAEALPDLEGFELPWSNETQFLLHIEDSLLSELPPDGNTIPEPDHLTDNALDWPSHTAWMSGRNSIPSFSYIEATFSNRPIQTDSKKRKRANFDESQTQTLQSWLALHKDNPYPTEEEYLSLCTSTGLELKQVRNWFARTRQRKLVRHGTSTYQAPWADQGRSTKSKSAGSASSVSNEHSSRSSTIAFLSLNARAGSSAPSDGDSERETERDDLRLEGPSIPNPSTVKLHSHDSKLEWWLNSIRDDVPSQLRFPYPEFNLPFDNVFDVEYAHSESLTFDVGESEYAIASAQEYTGTGPSILDSKLQESTDIQQRFRTHIGFLLRRGKDSSLLNTPGSSNSSLQSLLRRMRNVKSAARSRSPSIEGLSDNGRSLFSQQSFESKISLRSAATSFSFGSRKGRKPQYGSSSIDLHENGTDLPNHMPSVTGNRPNKNRCRFCQKSFSRMSSAVRHEKAVHAPDHWWICGSGASANAIPCPICSDSDSLHPQDCPHELEKCNFKPMKDRVFLRRDNFQDHLRRLHNMTRTECAKLDLKKWKHDQGDVTAILDAQKKARDFHDGLKRLDKIPAVPHDWSVTLKETVDEVLYDAEDIPMELDCQRLPRVSPTQSTRKFSYRTLQDNRNGSESSLQA